MDAITPAYRGLPVYLTEFCVTGKAWENKNTGVIVQAYQEINAWNHARPDRPISCLAVYRWQHDLWTIKDKPLVIEDFWNAVADGLTWPPVTVPVEPDPDPDPGPPQNVLLDYAKIEEIVARITAEQLAPVVAQLDEASATLDEAIERLRLAGVALSGRS